MSSIARRGCATPFVEGLAVGLIRYQCCLSCERPQNLAKYRCVNCGSKSLIWADSAGVGNVQAVTAIRRASDPVFQALVPYVIVLVRMREAFSLMAIQDPSESQEGLSPDDPDSVKERSCRPLQIGDLVRLYPKRWGEQQGLVAFRSNPLAV